MFQKGQTAQLVDHVKSLLQNALLARARAKIRVEATDGSSFASVSSAGSAAERFGESVGMRGACMASSVIRSNSCANLVHLARTSRASSDHGPEALHVCVNAMCPTVSHAHGGGRHVVHTREGVVVLAWPSRSPCTCSTAKAAMYTTTNVGIDAI